MVFSQPAATLSAVVTQAAVVLTCVSPSHFVCVFLTALGAHWEATLVANPVVVTLFENAFVEGLQRF